MKESGENYLETILLLEKELGVVRSIDVANRLGVTKASVSRAMGILKNEGLLGMDECGALMLSRTGRTAAESVYERHCTIRRYLTLSLALSEDVAERDACRIEHIISDETLLAMNNWLNKNVQK